MAILSSGSLQREVIVQVFIYALGLITNPSPLFFVTILLAGIILVVLSMLWPPCVLEAAEAQIKEIETLLHDECARRRNASMANISAQGLTRLDVLRVDVARLLDRHRALFHFGRVHRYVRIVYKLSRDSQRCLRDVKNLRIDLEQKIRALDLAAIPAQNEVNAGPATLPESSLPVTSSVDTV